MLPVSKHDAHLSPMERGQWWVIVFWGRGTRVMETIHHLRMSHHSDAHESCTLMLPVSKHDTHLSPMERGQWWVIIFWGRGTRVMTPIHHLRMSHRSDAHRSCTLMLPVSKHDAHLSPMERGQWWVIIFWGRGTTNMALIYHLRMSHHPDDTKFKIWCQYSNTLNNILNQPLKCVHTEGIKQFYKNTLVYCIR